MLGTVHRRGAASRSSSRIARSSKNRSLRDDSCIPGDRLLWESCSRPCRDRSRRTREKADYSRTTSRPPLATLPALGRQRALTGQPRKATGTRGTHQVNTIGKCKFVHRGETETSARPRRQRARKRQKEKSRHSWETRAIDNQ